MMRVRLKILFPMLVVFATGCSPQGALDRTIELDRQAYLTPIAEAGFY